jgi:hypothetical protein
MFVRSRMFRPTKTSVELITFFTTAKPFRGHDAIIQRNALASWKLLHSDIEVILFGDDQGAGEVCAELGLRHESYVERHESGTKRLDYMFTRAQQISGHEYLCFANCDIILMQDFWRAFERARAWRRQFLLVAQRWDTDIAQLIDLRGPNWASALRQFTLGKGHQQDEFWIDIFLFGRGLYLDMPPLLVGHCYWDNWMIWKALREGVPVIDGTRFIMPVHQNHGYSAASGRIKGVPNDPLSLVNLDLIGGLSSTGHIKSSTHSMGRGGRIYWSARRYTRPAAQEMAKIALYKIWLPVWHFVLDVTRPLRSMLGLRSKKSV